MSAPPAPPAAPALQPAAPQATLPALPMLAPRNPAEAYHRSRSRSAPALPTNSASAARKGSASGSEFMGAGAGAASPMAVLASERAGGRTLTAAEAAGRARGGSRGLVGLRRELARGGLPTHTIDATAAMFARRGWNSASRSPQSGAVASPMNRSLNADGFMLDSTVAEARSPAHRRVMRDDTAITISSQGSSIGFRDSASVRDGGALLGRWDIRFQDPGVELDFTQHAWQTNAWLRRWLVGAIIASQIARAAVFVDTSGVNSAMAGVYVAICLLVALLLAVGLVPTDHQLQGDAMVAWPKIATFAAMLWESSLVVLDGCLACDVGVVSDVRSLDCRSLEAGVVPWTVLFLSAAVPTAMALAITDWRYALGLACFSPWILISWQVGKVISYGILSPSESAYLIGATLLVNCLAPVAISFAYEHQMRDSFAHVKELGMRLDKLHQVQLERDQLHSISERFRARASMGRRSDAVLTYLTQQLKGQVDYARDTVADLEVAAELSFRASNAIRECRRPLDTAASLITDVELLSNADQAAIKVQPRHFDVRQSLQRIVQASQVRSGVRIHLVVDDAVPIFMRHDYVRLEQVLTTAISSALRRDEDGAVPARYVAVFVNVVPRRFDASSQGLISEFGPMSSARASAARSPASAASPGSAAASTPSRRCVSTPSSTDVLQFAVIDDGAALHEDDVAMFGADDKFAHQVAGVSPERSRRAPFPGDYRTLPRLPSEEEDHAAELITGSSMHAAGLALCNRLVGLMMGQFGAHSRLDITRGAVIWARLPVLGVHREGDLDAPLNAPNNFGPKPIPEEVDSLWQGAADSSRGIDAASILRSGGFGDPRSEPFSVEELQRTSSSSEHTDVAVSTTPADDHASITHGRRGSSASEHSGAAIASARLGKRDLTITSIDAAGIAATASPRGFRVLTPLTTVSPGSGVDSAERTRSGGGADDTLQSMRRSKSTQSLRDRRGSWTGLRAAAPATGVASTPESSP